MCKVLGSVLWKIKEAEIIKLHLLSSFDHLDNHRMFDQNRARKEEATAFLNLTKLEEDNQMVEKLWTTLRSFCTQNLVPL